jgi:hypothetical protein
MRLKLFEVLDRHTCIPVFAFRAQPTKFDELGADAHLAGEQTESELFLLGRTGFGLTGSSDCVIVGKLIGGECQYDCYDWKDGSRTLKTAHDYITKNFDTLKSGAVIDVEFIAGETTTPRPSDRFFTL